MIQRSSCGKGKTMMVVMMCSLLVLVPVLPVQATAKSTPLRPLSGMTKAFVSVGNSTLNGTITANELIGIATRLKVQADAWQADGTSARILAYAKAHPQTILAAPTSTTFAILYGRARLAGWQGTEEQLAYHLAHATTASDRAKTYNALVSQGLHKILYDKAAEFESIAKNFQLASAQQQFTALQLIPVIDNCAAIAEMLGGLALFTAVAPGAEELSPLFALTAFSFGVLSAHYGERCL